MIKVLVFTYPLVSLFNILVKFCAAFSGAEEEVEASLEIGTAGDTFAGVPSLAENVKM